MANSKKGVNGMKLYYLGTCSGTEPMPGTHHCSMIMECGDSYYWFDAGENCAHRSHTTPGIYPRKTRAMFISHPHIDHIGGLPNLFEAWMHWAWKHEQPALEREHLELFFPDMQVLEAVKIMQPVGGAEPWMLRLKEHEIADGHLYRDENVTVSAVHNRHMGEDGSNGYHSYSFLVEHDGYRVVYSGDVAAPEELDCFAAGGCDLLIMESGHHKVADICDYAKKWNIKHLHFYHHGRQILEDRPRWQAYVEDFARENDMHIVITNDGDILEL